MQKRYSIAGVRKELSQLPSKFVESSDLSVVQVTRRGEPVLAILDWQRYTAIVETLEILSDEETTKKLKEAVKELDAGTNPEWELDLQIDNP
ncbi:MAG: prevent-host-death family protein [Gemmatimonadetes bacterium]|jgi:antitoxin YefM|nr:prevent-host-death family protein [Gemmatimonadota bacterium]|tara:strand:+ start:307 stop:582 length:276 start_codon:yes stop_codon:yes gene_type:complete